MSTFRSYHHSIATMNTSLLWNNDCSELRNVATNAVKNVLMCSNYTTVTDVAFRKKQQYGEIGRAHV